MLGVRKCWLLCCSSNMGGIWVEAWAGFLVEDFFKEGLSEMDESLSIAEAGHWASKGVEVAAGRWIQVAMSVPLEVAHLGEI